MASLTTTVTAITDIVRGRITAVPLDPIIGQPTLPAVRKIVEQLATFTSHFSTSAWGGKHGHLALVLDEKKMRAITNDGALDCSRLKKPGLVHPSIDGNTKGRDLLEFQEKHKQTWAEYHSQMVIDAVAVEAIVAAVDVQYLDQLSEEYVGYKNATIKTMVAHLRTWFVITNAEKIAIKAAFHAPWADTPNAHVTTFARQLDRRQIECLDHGVTITNAEKVVHFIEQMYTCGLFEARFLDDWEESLDKSWATTPPLFVTQFNKERRTLERANQNKNFASANVFRERHSGGHAPTFAPTAPTTTTADYNAAMEYAAAMEAKSTAQDGRILELEDALDDQTALTLPSELAASATTATTGTAAAATELAAMRAMIQSLAATVAALTTKSATDGGGGGRGRDKKGGGGPPNGTVETPGTHKCVNCKLWVKHKDANCYELAANAAKRFPGWVTRLKK